LALSFLWVAPALLWLLPAAAQAQAIEAWVQRYNGPGNGDDYPQAMAVDASGNVVVTGSSYGGDPLYGGSSMDYATIKYSNAGVPLWTNRYNGPGNANDSAAALALDANGNVIVTGYSDGGDPAYGGSRMDYATIKYSNAGVPLWTNRYNGPGNGNDSAVALATDAAGNVVVSGQSEGIVGSWYNATLKYSSAGVPLWTNFYGGNVSLYDNRSMALDSSGNVVLTVPSQVDCITWNDFLTIKYSSAGVPLWTNRFNGPGNGNDAPHAVAVDASGNVYVSGSSDGITSPDYATIKYSSAGVLLWTNFYNGPGNSFDDAHAVAVDASGNVYVTGDTATSQGSSTGIGYDEDYATIAYSSSGVPLWTNRYNGPGDKRDFGRAVLVDATGSVYVTGSSESSAGDADFVTIKYVIPPVIARQPVSRTNAVGTTASFSVEAAGGLPLSYHWRRGGTNLVDGGNLSGVTTTNLLIADVQPADAGGYTVVVTNAYGSVTSSVAQLTVTIPPSPGRFTRLSYSPETGLSFIFRDATPGQPYRIQTSTSLAEASWTDWMSFNYTGPMLLTDLGAAETTNKFYRAISP